MKPTATRSGHAQKQSVMHVGKFYRPCVGGIETHVETLCKELRKSMDVRVLVANNARRGEKCLIDGVPVTRAGSSCQHRRRAGMSRHGVADSKEPARYRPSASS